MPPSPENGSKQSGFTRPSRPVETLRRKPTAVALLILVGGLLLTTVTTLFEISHVNRRDQDHYAQLVERIQTEVSRRVTIYRYGMMGTRSVFAASNYVDYGEFLSLVAARELDQEFPGALGLGYIQRVPNDAEAVEAFVQQVRDEGAPWFEMSIPPGAEPLPGAVDDDRHIIKYIEPLSDNRSAHGLDIGAHPVRREASQRAMLSGDACLTGTIQLVQDKEDVAGFLYLLPHYRSGMPLETPEQRTEALVGWVYMPLLAPKVFEGIMAVADNEVDVEVFDGEELADDKLIFDGDNHLSKIESTVYSDEDYHGRQFHSTVPVEIGGRTWTLSLSTTPQFNGTPRTEIYTLSLGGVLLTVLVSLMVYLQGTATRRAWALAEGMTKDLREYATQAEEATRAKSDFLANMSHEIRTPMTAILGFTDLLRTQIDQDNEELIAHTQTIKRNGDHLLSLINDILDMSKIEAGKLEVEQIAVRPAAITSEVMSLMRVKADEKNLPLEAEFMTPIPRAIIGDPVRLRQVLVNLIGNAIKFTDAGRIRIEVRYDEQMEELKFAVSDTGIGMTEEQVTRLFGAFQQADTTTTRQFGGTGLGLHISQRLATLLGGTITCNSTYGQGSTFTVTIYTSTVDTAEMLPAGNLDVIVNEDPKPEAVASNQDENRLPLEGVRILLAEDGIDNQRLINHHLTKAGAAVAIVDNGKLAVQALCVNDSISGPLITDPPFDLLLTDMQMPEMDGYTAAALLRKLGSSLPIVALTAHAMKEDIDKCLNAGCDLYASKPIAKQKLIEVCLEAAARNTQAA